MSTMKPIAHVVKPMSKLSCLLFSEKSPIVVCGSDKGDIGVYRLHNVDRRNDSAPTQSQRLDEVMRTNVIKAQAGN